MKSIVLSVVVISALISAGVGGILADFSDYEVSEDNSFSTGALDLVLSDYAGNEYDGDDVPAFVTLGDAWPCCTKDYYIDIHNYGQGDQFVPYLYLHFKNFSCFWVVPKNIYKWIDCENGACVEVAAPEPPAGGWVEGVKGTGLPKPVNEPEYAAECGGVVGEDADGNSVEVPGVGCCYGEDCQLDEHVDLAIFIAGPYDHDTYPKAEDVPSTEWSPVNLSDYDLNDDGKIKLSEIMCVELELGQLPNCEKFWIDLRFHLQDVPEEYFDMYYFPDDSKFDHWPTNALQKDGLEFDMAFELLQNKYVPPD
jgi:hypothetical protein